jgi:hypothetical protein
MKEAGYPQCHLIVKCIRPIARIDLERAFRGENRARLMPFGEFSAGLVVTTQLFEIASNYEMREIR